VDLSGDSPPNASANASYREPQSGRVGIGRVRLCFDRDWAADEGVEEVFSKTIHKLSIRMDKLFAKVERA